MWGHGNGGKETPEEYRARKERQQREWEDRQRERERKNREWEQRKAQQEREYQERQRNREKAASIKRSLISQAKSIANTSDFKSGAKQMKDLMDDWKSAGSAGKDLNDSLWSDFQSARKGFFDRRERHFQEIKRKMDVSASKKQSLISQARSVSMTNDFKSGAQKMNALMDEWKSTPSAGKERNDSLWKEFQSARQKFYDRRESMYAQNKKEKSFLVSQAISLSSSTDLKKGTEEAKSLQSKWKQLGYAGKDDQDLWKRFDQAISTFFDKKKQDYEKRKKECEGNIREKERIISELESFLSGLSDYTTPSAESYVLRLKHDFKVVGFACQKNRELKSQMESLVQSFFDEKNAQTNWSTSRSEEGGHTAHIKLEKRGFVTSKYGKGVGILEDEARDGFTSIKSPSGGKSSITFHDDGTATRVRQKGGVFGNKENGKTRK